MAKKIEYQIGFKTDQSGLSEVKKTLDAIAVSAKIPGNAMKKELQEAGKTASSLRDILDSAWNSKLGQLNLNKLNTDIKKTFGSTEQLKNSLVQGGIAGAQAYNQLASNILNTNLQIKQSNKLLDEMAVTFKNTVRYGISSSIFNTMANTVQRAYDYSVKLDTSLNDIRIVTNKSAQDMEKFAVQANKAAKALGSNTRDYTNASLIYYQQGLSEAETQARTETTIKAANVTGQTGADVSEQLTAVWNGYKVSAEETELYVDKLAAVAASTAADLEELSTGMSKVASAANSAGVDVDQLNGMLATVVSVTREAPETIGSSFKTIFARLGDLTLGGTDEDGVGLGKVSGQLDALGIQILDEMGNMRDMGDVIEDIAAKWETWTQAQRQAAAVAMAGKMQYSRLIALFDNWDMYSEAVETSKNAIGTLQEQQDIYMDSTEAHLQKIRAESERTYDILFDTKSVNTMADAMSGLLGVFNDLLAGLGGGISDFVYFGSVVGNVFKKQIGGAISTQLQNMEAVRANEASSTLKQDIINAHAVEGDSLSEASLQKEMEYAQRILNIQSVLTEEEYKQLTASQQQIGKLEQRIQGITSYEKIAKQVGISSKNISIQNFEEELTHSNKKLKNIYDNVELIKQGIDKWQNSSSKELENAETRAKLGKSISDELVKVEATGKHINQIQTIRNKLEKGNYLTQSEVNLVLSAQRKSRNEEIQKIELIKQGIQGIRDREDGVLGDLELQKEQRENAIKQIEEQKQRQMAITSLVGQFSSLVGVVTGVSGIFKTLGDESLSAGEKIKQVLITSLSLAPQIVTLFKGMPKLLTNIAVAFIPTITAEKAATMGAKELGAAIWKAISGVLPEVLAITAVIVGLGIAVKAMIDYWNESSKAEENARIGLQQLTKNYQECSQAAEDLKKNISEYQEAKEKLKELTEGTEEYKSALEEANEKAKELIETHKLYNQYTVKNGQIEIEDSALSKIQEQADQRSSNAQIQMYSGQVAWNTASNINQFTDLSRSSMRLDEYATLTTFLGPLGTAISEEISKNRAKEISSGLGELENLIGTDKFDELMLKSEDELANSLLRLDELPQALKDNIDVLVENKESFLDYKNSIDEAAEANRYYASQILETKLRDEYSVTGASDEQANQIYSILANRDSSARDELADRLSNIDLTKVTSNSSLNKLYGYDISNDEDLAKTYARVVLGIKDTSKLTYKGGSNIGSLKDEKGEAIFEDISDDVMRRELARTVATDRILKETNLLDQTDFTNSLNEMLKTSDKFGKEYGVNFTDVLLNTIRSETNEVDLSQIYAGLKPSEVEELSKMTPEELQKVLGIDDNIIAELGEDFVSKFQASLKEYQWDAETAINTAIGEKSSELDSLGLSKKKLEEYTEDIKVYASNLMQVAKNSSELDDSLSEDADMAVDLAFKIIKLNKAVDTLADNIENWTDVINNSSEMSQEYAEAMDGIKSALEDIYGIEKKYVSNDFVAKHLEEIQKISEGSEEAIEDLRDSLQDDLLVNILISNDIENQDGIILKFQSLRDRIEETMSGLSVGQDLDTSSFILKLNDLIADTGMSIEQVNSLLNSMNLEPTFETQEMQVPRVEKITETRHEIIDQSKDGKSWTARDYVTDIGEKRLDNTVTVFGISGDGTPPKIKTLKKSADSSMNNYSSINTGGKSPGKSSGSGGGSSKKQDKMDPLKEEADRYHQIDAQIQLIENDLSMIDKAKEKAFGSDLINLLNNQLSKLDKQINNYNKKIQIAQGEAEELRNKLSGKGIRYNDDGTIGNYVQAIKAQEDYVNSLINNYNSMSAEAQESYKDTVEQAKKDFEDFKTNIDRYDEVITDLIPGLRENIQDAIDEQIGIQIEEFNMEIDIRLNMKEAEKDWLDFRKKVIDQIKDDNILGNAVASLAQFKSFYEGMAGNLISNNAQHLRDIMAQLDEINAKGNASIYGDNRKQALEDLKNYLDEITNNMEEMEDLADEVRESYLEMMDEANEKFEDQISLYEQISSLIEHDMKVIELVRGEDSYKELAQYYDRQEENYQYQLNFQSQQVQFWKQQIELAEEGSERWLEARNNWQDALDNWNSTIEAAIENIRDKWINAINEIFQKLNDKVTNGLGLDYVSEEWTLINNNADQYLDTINRLYGIQKVQAKYLEGIDQTNSVTAQRKLNELMNQEIKALQERDKLTQYDIERAEKKYQIALKQIALEEAQQNKSTMRLRRDSQGNYTYQFVEDQSATGKLKDELNDLYNQLYNFDLSHYKDNLNQILSSWTEYQDKMAEAAQINDPVKRAEKEMLIQEQYGQMINGLVEQNEQVRMNLYESGSTELAQLRNEDLENFQKLSDAEKDIMFGEMIPQWESGVQYMAEVFAGEGGFVPVCEDAINDLHDVTKQYEQDLKELEEAGNFSFEAIYNGIDNAIDYTQTLLEDNDELINKYGDELRAVQAVIDELDTLISKYRDAKTEALAATDAAYKYWQLENQKAAEAAQKAQAEAAAKKAAEIAKAKASVSAGTPAGGSSGGDGILSVGDTATYSGRYYSDSYGGGASGSAYSGVTRGIIVDRIVGNPYGVHIHSADGRYPDLGWIKKEQLTGYDTGGYTGSWGNSGRLGILHQKELVLNSSDTKNMLDIVSVVRDVMNRVGNSINAGYTNIRTAFEEATQNSGVSQNIVINADFPNVENSKEIENAFDNLLNIASMRANRS